MLGGDRGQFVKRNTERRHRPGVERDVGTEERDIALATTDIRLERDLRERARARRLHFPAESNSCAAPIARSRAVKAAAKSLSEGSASICRFPPAPAGRVDRTTPRREGSGIFSGNSRNARYGRVRRWKMRCVLSRVLKSRVCCDTFSEVPSTR